MDAVELGETANIRRDEPLEPLEQLGCERIGSRDALGIAEEAERRAQIGLSQR
jgi:hypothetical protein